MSATDPPKSETPPDDAQSGDTDDRHTPTRSRRRLVQWALAGLALIVAIAAIGIGGLMLAGPTEMAFVGERVRSGLQERLGDGYDVRVGRSVVDAGRSLIEVEDTTVADPSGAVVARLPRMRLRVDPLSLLMLDVSITEVEIDAPEIAIDRVATEDTSGLERAFRDPDHAIVGFDAALDRLSTESGLRRLALTGGTIAIRDVERDAVSRFDATELVLTIDPETRTLESQFTTTGAAGRWSARLERRLDSETGERTMAGGFSQVTLADLLPTADGAKKPPAFDIPLFAGGEITLSSEGVVTGASGHLDVGAGVIPVGDDRPDVLLDEARLNVRWDTAEQVLLVDRSTIFFGETRGTMSGRIRVSGEPGDGRFGFVLESHDAVLAARDVAEPPLMTDRVALAGTLDLTDLSLEVADFSIDTPDGSLSLAGSIGFEGESLSLVLTGALSPMRIATLKQMWTPFLAPGARRWVLDNMSDGRIEAGAFTADLPAGTLDRENPVVSDEGLQLDLRLADVAFRVFGDLPPISDASGALALTGAALGVHVDSATVRVPSGETVRIESGAFTITDVFDPAVVAEADVELSGTASALGAIADAQPLEVLARRGVKPDDLSGDADVSLSLRMPLEETDGDFEDAIQWMVTVVGRGLASRVPIEGRRFDNADVTLVVTPDRFEVSGTADIDGVSAGVSFSQPLDAAGESSGPGQQLARLLLDEAARAKLGLAIDDIVGGTVGVQISGLNEGIGQHYDLDLAAARLTVPGLGWTKGVGVPAALSFDLVPHEDGSVAENIVLDGEGFGFTGTARFDAAGGLVSAAIDRFALRPGDAMTVTLKADGEGYAIDARGAAFDLRGIITELTDPVDGGALPDLTIDVALGRATGFNDSVLENARARFVSADGDPIVLRLDGILLGEPVDIDYVDESHSALLTANAANVGDVLRFLDLYTRLAGGKLSIKASRPGPRGPLVGRAVIEDFVILDEPAIEQAIARAPTRQGIDTARLHFDRMVARFQLSSDALTIDEALLRGQALGATFRGVVDLIGSLVSINGTYLPLYALNSAFGRVPVIGKVLAGGKREGLIGVTFRVEGALDDPQVFFNPLSAVAPGIFRKIFEFR